MSATETIEPRTPLGRAVLWWFPLAGPIGAWTVHLVFLASWVRHGCNTGTEWPMHLVTAVTAVIALAGIVLSRRLVRLGADAEDADTAAGRLRFLGLLGLVVGIFNLALILLEGSYVLLFHGHRCVV